MPKIQTPGALENKVVAIEEVQELYSKIVPFLPPVSGGFGHPNKDIPGGLDYGSVGSRVVPSDIWLSLRIKGQDGKIPIYGRPSVRSESEKEYVRAADVVATAEALGFSGSVDKDRYKKQHGKAWIKPIDNVGWNSLIEALDSAEHFGAAVKSGTLVAINSPFEEGEVQAARNR